MKVSMNNAVLGVGLLFVSGIWLAQDVARPPAEQASARAGVALIRVYQQQIHPYSHPYVCCRLQPTCSRYGIEALQRKGAAGVVDIGERLVMCSRTPVSSARRAQPTPAPATVGLGAPRVSASAVWLQPSEDEAAGAACALGLIMMILIGVGLVATWIALLVFVVRDAKNRGTENPVLWLILILFTHVVGLVIYFLARPAGNLVACEHCKNKKLQYARTCPHCGNPDARAAAAGTTTPPAPPAAPAS